MAERMSTADRMDRARKNGRVTRAVNSLLKRKERAHRDERMKKLITAGTFPYLPSVRSWLSGKVGKPFTQITEQEALHAISG